MPQSEMALTTLEWKKGVKAALERLERKEDQAIWLGIAIEDPDSDVKVKNLIISRQSPSGSNWTRKRRRLT
jgi:hypothetical protein